MHACISRTVTYIERSVNDLAPEPARMDITVIKEQEQHCRINSVKRKGQIEACKFWIKVGMFNIEYL